MKKLVYLFELDSACNSKKEIINAQYILFKEILFKGNKVVLSYNQLSDSKVFFKMIENDKIYEHLLELFRLGYIKISQYKRSDNEEVRTASQYIQSAIKKCKKEKNNEDLFDIKISDESYSTSNQGNTFVEIDNQKYGHILSPKTGYPGKNKQIGIVTKEAFTGDIISTGLYNQTPEKFFEILDKLNRETKVEGYMIDENGKIHYSEGFLKYIVKE